MGDFSKGGVHKTDGFWWVLECFFIASKNLAPGAVILANTVIVLKSLYGTASNVMCICSFNLLVCAWIISLQGLWQAGIAGGLRKSVSFSGLDDCNDIQ